MLRIGGCLRGCFVAEKRVLEWKGYRRPSAPTASSPSPILPPSQRPHRRRDETGSRARHRLMGRGRQPSGPGSTARLPRPDSHSAIPARSRHAALLCSPPASPTHTHPLVHAPPPRPLPPRALGWGRGGGGGLTRDSAVTLQREECDNPKPRQFLQNFLIRSNRLLEIQLSQRRAAFEATGQLGGAGVAKVVLPARRGWGGRGKGGSRLRLRLRPRLRSLPPWGMGAMGGWRERGWPGRGRAGDARGGGRRGGGRAAREKEQGELWSGWTRGCRGV